MLDAVVHVHRAVAAAFPVAAALILGKSEIRIEDVLVNPLRLGFFETLLEMGAKISYDERRDPIGEPIADMVSRSLPAASGAMPSVVARLAPSTGTSPRPGTFVSFSRRSVWRMPPRTTVWPSPTSTVVVSERGART